MSIKPGKQFAIRRAHSREYEELGHMTVDAYRQLAGMPGVAEQPDYYAMLYDVQSRANTPTIDILIAVTPDDELLGGVTFVGDMAYYGSGGTASSQKECSGIRLLAVKAEARGCGVGSALTAACIRKARQRGSAQVILHTTKAMQVAWGMYARMGFHRSPDLDFNQGDLAVFGFRLDIHALEDKR